MASGGPKNTSYNAEQVSGQGQMRRDDVLNQPSNIHSEGQAANFLQETETQVKNIAQGAADMGKGAAQGAVSIAKGAALGAANMAQGAAEAVKNTLGINNPTTGAATGNHPGSTNNPGSTNPRI